MVIKMSVVNGYIEDVPNSHILDEAGYCINGVVLELNDDDKLVLKNLKKYGNKIKISDLNLYSAVGFSRIPLNRQYGKYVCNWLQNRWFGVVVGMDSGHIMIQQTRGPHEACRISLLRS